MIFGTISFIVFKMRTIIKNFNDDTFIYYSEHDLLKDKFDIEYIQKIAYIQFTVDTQAEEVNVGYIYVSEKNRGKKLAEQLVREMISYTYDQMKENQISRYEIKLDDMSNRYGMKDNLYIKTGFTYCEVDDNGPCGPEMSMCILVGESENEK
jgi:predicted GNAT family N-acyltransferase